ncbi:hypothetical protein GQ55_7G104200 [Panicum hallii var. hallii]|uniref:Uncharacterized protein n=1 Tax=Panicum hallii var. hallii TaxID=1504633 RepID=A0A2T7CTN8_9POAL|nr:hypothetical protein GQ55_7G104200 [Panicum hallii var. hallii]
MVTEYMTKKAESARLHHVRQCGTQELKFEVSPKDRVRHGMRCQTPIKEKETIASTWQYEIYGFRLVGSFTETANPVIYISDPRSSRVKRGRRQSRRIRNDMDESELRPRIQRCSACNQIGHTYKHCPTNDAGPSSAEASPTGDATDGRPPVASRSGRHRRSSASP